MASEAVRGTEVQCMCLRASAQAHMAWRDQEMHPFQHCWPCTDIQWLQAASWHDAQLPCACCMAPSCTRTQMHI